MHRNPHFILIDVEKNFSNSTIYNPLKSPWRRDKLPTPVLLGFPGGSAGKEAICNVGDLDSIPGLGRSPEEGETPPTPVFWPGEFHGLHSLWGHKELDTTERLSLSPALKAISCIAGKLFTTEPPGSPRS